MCLTTSTLLKGKFKFIPLVLSLGVVAGFLFLSLFPSASREPQSQWCTSSRNDRIPDEDAGWINGFSFANRRVKFREHAGGQFDWQFNNYSFREEKNTEEIPALGLTRVIVTGDSHMEGAVNSNETFANRLEDRLNHEMVENPHFEVLSGGVAFYSFKNYFGYLKKYLHLKPKLYVVVTFLGNDFLEAIKEDTCGKNPWATDAYFTRLVNAHSASGRDGMFWQGMNQAYLFQNEEARQMGLELAERHTMRLQTLARENDIDLLFVLLPSKIEVEPGRGGKVLRQAAEDLGLSSRDLMVNREVGLEYGRALKRLGIEYTDPYLQMLNSPEELYWKRDYHLSSKGHDRLAEIVYRSEALRKLRLKWELPSNLSRQGALKKGEANRS